ESTKYPFVIRYPRGEGVMPEWKTAFEQLTIGKGRKLKDGENIAILTFGHPGNFAQAAIRELRTNGINPAHYDLRFVKPIDEDLLHEVFTNYNKVITVEDGTVVGGFGSAVVEFMAAHHYNAEIKILGIPDRIVEHGTLKELHRECEYDTEAIVEAVKNMSNIKVKTEQMLMG
ncbi:MAG TPA: transketolase C-terminal domain-containing protein, partial [Chitinophagaceae bacterium]|nr:transketolase C-terminal domain-containing protein [Chitinophagaceae bacterium]